MYDASGFQVKSHSEYCNGMEGFMNKAITIDDVY